MLYKVLWILLFISVFSLQKINGNISVNDSEDRFRSTVVDIFPQFEEMKSLIALHTLIEESYTMMKKMLGQKSFEEVKQKLRGKEPKLIEFFDRVSKLTINCLEKFETREQSLRNAVKCFTEAVGNEKEQVEDAEEVPPMQSCLEETMLAAATETETLLMEAINQTRDLQDLVRQMGRRLVNCRGHLNPFECVKEVRLEIHKNTTSIRKKVIDTILNTRYVYTNYMDDITLCITSVEELEPDNPSTEDSTFLLTTSQKFTESNDKLSARG